MYGEKIQTGLRMVWGNPQTGIRDELLEEVRDDCERYRPLYSQRHRGALRASDATRV